MPLIWNWVGGKNTWVQVTFDCTKRQSLWRAAWKGRNCSYLAMWREFQHSLSCAHFLLGQVLRLMHVIAFPAPAPLWTQGFVCCYLQYVKQLDRTWFCCICICFYELAYTYAFGLATSSQTTLNSWWANTVCIARPAQGRTSCGWTAPPQRKPPGNSLWKPLGFP